MVHQVVAIGSRDLTKAEAFVDETGADRAIVKAYGTYEEVYADPVSDKAILTVNDSDMSDNGAFRTLKLFISVSAES